MNGQLSPPSNSKQYSPSRWLARLDYGLMLALLVPLFAVMPLLTHAGLPNTADGPAHLMRQVELNQAWQEGNFYPRWGADLALGHGMPIFSYAPPALYQLTQLFHMTGLPLDESMKAVLVFDFLLYSLGMFLLARALFGSGPALVAAAVYVYAPYRLREAYIQGNYGQFTGLAFYPLILWAFQRLVVVGGARYLVLAALSLAGLLFSHNISFMLLAPLLAAYLLFLLFAPVQATGAGLMAGQPFVHRLGRVAAAVLLGLGLSAIFWLPAFGERDAIKLEGITQGFFDFRENFISLREYLSPPLPLDLAAINPEFPLSLGLPQIFGSLAGILALVLVSGLTIRWKRKSVGQNRPGTGFEFGPVIFFTLFFLLYTFLALPQSATLWETVPLLELAEFPWRMLGPAILCASLLAAYAAHGATHWTSGRFGARPRRYLYALLAVILLIIALNAYYLYPSQFVQWGTPGPADAFAYEVTSGAIGTTSTGEFLPRTAQEFPRPDTLWPDYVAGQPPQKIDPATLPAGARVVTVERRAESETFLVDTPHPFAATVRTLYWPGWQVYIDDQPVAFTITDKTGLIQVPLPAGQSILKLRLVSTPLRSTGLWLTLLSGLVLAGLGLLSLWRPMAGPIRPEPAIPARFFVAGSAVLVGFYLLSRPLAPLFVLQSNPDQPLLADQTLLVDFGRNPAGPEQQPDPQDTPLLRLVGRDNFPATVQLNPNGETELDVTVYWRALRPLLTNYAVFLHLDLPDGRTVATADEAPPENIPTRNWPPGLYLRNPLELKIPAGLPPVRYQVNVGLYHRETGERLAVWPWAREQTTYTLGHVWLVEAGPEPAGVSPLAHFGPDITLVGADLGPAGGDTLTLAWRADRPVDRDYSIFVHLLDAEGQLLGQVDGVPFDGLYPLSHWRPGQVIQDIRSMPLATGAALPVAIALGIYDPATGERLPAVDSQGRSLSQNSYVLPVPSE